MIDDDQEDYELISYYLKELSATQKRHYTVDWVSSFKEGCQLITQNQYDVYLVEPTEKAA